MKKRMIIAASAALAMSALCMQAQTISTWKTEPDRSQLFSPQEDKVEFTVQRRETAPYIVVDPARTYQTMDGFGFALTGGSAEHLIKMSPEARQAILEEMFDPAEGMGFSYIRLTLGASDLNSFVFSYDDMPEGKEDFKLKHFSLSQDLKDVVPVMYQILGINPNIKIMSSPWSAPVWMKESGNVRGGKLRKDCYRVYAEYFAKYVKAMEKEGIHIDAVTIQNEPLNSRNTPSMPWDPADQAEFVRDHLGPIFEAEGIDTDIVVFDHNCDRPDYALAIYNDPEAEKYVAGAAYHHYRGDLSAMSYVYEARPDKDIYFTEQMTTERPGTQQINIASAVNRLIIGITRNWSKNVVLWNLAADPLNDPHTDNGGCSMCQGAITIDGDIVTRNIAYYVIAHASKLVPPGSKRIFSTAPGERIISIAEDEQHPGIWRTNVIEHANVPDNVTFMTPQGKVVMIVSNDSWSRREVNIQYNGKFATLRINPGSVATYIWDAE